MLVLVVSTLAAFHPLAHCTAGAHFDTSLRIAHFFSLDLSFSHSFNHTLGGKGGSPVSCVVIVSFTTFCLVYKGRRSAQPAF